MSILPSFMSSLPQPTKPKPVIYREYGVNFSTGTLTGKIVEGTEALKVWVWLCLKTVRFRHAIYTWSYGVDTEQYIGKVLTDDFVRDDLLAEITEALAQHPAITGIEDYRYTRDGGRVKASFRVVNSLGEDIDAEL